MLNCRQLSSYRQRGLSLHCLLMIVSRKVCCLCVILNKLAADDGWLNAIHTCKGDGKKRRLDQDKRGVRR